MLVNQVPNFGAAGTDGKKQQGKPIAASHLGQSKQPQKDEFLTTGEAVAIGTAATVGTLALLGRYHGSINTAEEGIMTTLKKPFKWIGEKVSNGVKSFFKLEGAAGKDAAGKGPTLAEQRAGLAAQRNVLQLEASEGGKALKGLNEAVTKEEDALLSKLNTGKSDAERLTRESQGFKDAVKKVDDELAKDNAPQTADALFKDGSGADIENATELRALYNAKKAEADFLAGKGTDVESARKTLISSLETATGESGLKADSKTVTDAMAAYKKAADGKKPGESVTEFTFKKADGTDVTVNNSGEIAKFKALADEEKKVADAKSLQTARADLEKYNKQIADAEAAAKPAEENQAA